MKKPDYQALKAQLPAFREKTAAFYAGEVDKGTYKGFSGLFGSYAQKGAQASMLRLRMNAGRITKEKLAFLAKMLREQTAPRIHYTTCQTVQFHDLDGETAADIMEQAFDEGIITMGGGGDFPRNVMCSPLSGVEKGEYFDVMPYAQCAAEYLLNFVLAEKMPRKLKVGFSNSPANVTHATYRDLGFVACENGTFDVYCAGGLGNNPRFGVKVAEGVAPDGILPYIKAMWLTFRAYGNYENRGKARTRYMVQAVGGEEAYRKAYLEKLEEALASGEDFTMEIAPVEDKKQGDGSTAEGRWIQPQKQNGLYSVCWHPIGGMPDTNVFCTLADYLAQLEGAEIRLSPDESAYVINLTGAEAKKVEKILESNNAKTLFDTSVSCIGAATCQVGLRDSQNLLRTCISAVAEAGIPDGALPCIHISGCPSSCGTHQTGAIGFRGASKKVDGAPVSAFTMVICGESLQGKETMGRELGIVAETDIPALLIELGKTVAASGKGYQEWIKTGTESLEKIAQKYI